MGPKKKLLNLIRQSKKRKLEAQQKKQAEDEYWDTVLETVNQQDEPYRAPQAHVAQAVTGYNICINRFILFNVFIVSCRQK